MKQTTDVGGPAIDREQMPRHIAIIMDGNGRWAKRRGMPRVSGHRQGVQALKEIVSNCGDLGVHILTVYAFSTENWTRPRAEVTFLMRLLEDVLDNELEDLHNKGVQVRILGRRNHFSPHLMKKIEWAEALTRDNRKLTLNVCFNYGGRAEIIDAVKQIAEMAQDGRLSSSDDVNEQLLSDLMYTGGLPDPDLLIRTGGEFRVSNFLLWQLAYAEIWWTDVCWPDFGREHLMEAIADFQRRERRFGGL